MSFSILVALILNFIISSRATVISTLRICCINRINFGMDVSVAAKIVALRPALESLITKATADPESIVEPDPRDSELMGVIRQLSRPNAGTYSVINTEEGTDE